MRRRTSASDDFWSRKERTVLRSSSCSSEKAKFMPEMQAALAGQAQPVLCTHVLRVGIRELRNDVAAVVRRAGAGERVVVTVDGRPVAQLGPLEPAGLTLDDLVATGLVRPPSRSRPDDPE